jgi:hypothetical protein
VSERTIHDDYDVTVIAVVELFVSTQTPEDKLAGFGARSRSSAVGEFRPGCTRTESVNDIVRLPVEFDIKAVCDGTCETAAVVFVSVKTCFAGVADTIRHWLLPPA